MFCRILQGLEEGYILYRGNGVAVILDKYPVSKGHLLVLSEEHHEGVQDAPPSVLARVWITASALAKVYRVELKAPGVNVVANSGGAAGQVIYHFHVHVIPRWESMRGFWSGRRVLGGDEAREVLEMLKPHITIVEEYMESLGLSEIL
ncbi:MAG: HIT domain-containing protein [Thermoprotei archaeon]|nr:HIT domain-containing protein [Thermoprotei archaeon]